MSPTLASVLAESALRRPGHTALVHASRRIGYAELWYATRQYAAALRERGTRPGDRIALPLPNTPHFPMVYYGVLALGAVAVPVHGLLRAEEIAHGSALPVAVLEEFEEVFGCRCIGVPDEVYGEEVCAVVRTRPGTEPDPALAAASVAWCKERVAAYKYPRRV
ncbi:AMP-binding protein [Streptomyces corynorhini]|uniref:AMP-binding protein n=1 Tax=Streptomyces corynorhini TaxID=2282652 RepID=UPI001F35CB11|nr:AMP-binding protein [Streptomyces corynorhini]